MEAPVDRSKFTCVDTNSSINKSIGVRLKVRISAGVTMGVIASASAATGFGVITRAACDKRIAASFFTNADANGSVARSSSAGMSVSVSTGVSAVAGAVAGGVPYLAASLRPSQIQIR